MLRGMLGVYSGVEPRFREDYLPEPARAEVARSSRRARRVVLVQAHGGRSGARDRTLVDDGEGMSRGCGSGSGPMT